GLVDRAASGGIKAPLLGAAIGAAIGFYDGFFGPGTGSFLIFLFVRLVHLDFLRASVCAKIVNVATNLAAIVYFTSHGAVLWEVAVVMAACNLAGAQVGSYLALRNGAAFVRRFFLLVVVSLIGRLTYDQFMQ
ncbi:MAG: TSUP family transporter, partial [Zoogloea sp.]|nr:TSUP family transporter [Zoogloea sp.]